VSSLSFERIADSYDSTRGGEDRGRRFAAAVAPLLDSQRPVLEVGVGTGVVTLALGGLGFDVLGMDLSEAMLRRARQRVGPRVAAGDALRLPVRDGSFDQAVTVWVLHVVGDIEGALREVARVLRAGGRFVVIPAVGDRPSDPIGAIMWDLQRAIDPSGRHRDDEPNLRRFAPAAGLEVVESRPSPGYDYLESPAAAIAKLESRSYSILWTVPDDRWREVTQPAVDALRALPSPDRPIPRTSTDRVLLLSKRAR
jgi:SAM-dependent methyltransferase